MTEIVPYEKLVATVRDLLTRSQEQIKMALPRHMTPERMARLAMTSILRNPRLLECDPKTLIGAVIQCAQLGLEPGSNYGAHLVPFRNTKRGTMDVQVIPDYRGLMDLARRSERVSTIDAQEVYEKDEFRYKYGTDKFLHHVPARGEDRGQIIYFYAIAKLKDGEHQFVVREKWQVDKIRDTYSGAAGAGPWITNYVEMGKKTCVRQLADYLPASIELLTAAGLEAKAEQGIPQELGSLLNGEIAKDDGKPPEESKKSGGLASVTETLKDRKEKAKEGAPAAAPPPVGSARPVERTVPEPKPQAGGATPPPFEPHVSQAAPPAASELGSGTPAPAALADAPTTPLATPQPPAQAQPPEPAPERKRATPAPRESRAGLLAQIIELAEKVDIPVKDIETYCNQTYREKIVGLEVTDLELLVSRLRSLKPGDTLR